MNKQQEYILCSAIHFDDNEYHTHQEQYGTGFLISGYRHHNIIAIKSLLRSDIKYVETQGFLTSKDRFVDRKEGMQIALKAGQVLENSTINRYNLFSEDLF